MPQHPEDLIADKKRPFTGAEFLESLRDGREIYIYGERVKDVTEHPAFRNSARSVALLYDALHDQATKDVLTAPTDTGSGGYTMKFFKVAHSREDVIAQRDAIAAWARISYGWLGRSPDYKAAFLNTLGANAEFYGKFADNARAWYSRAQERVLYMNHALVHPPIDRSRPADEVADVCVHVEEETDNGLIVSGAKVVATASALTHQTFIAHAGLPLKDKRFAPIFVVDMNTPGVKLMARASYELAAAATGSPFDYPLSSRLDENDSILIFDRALIPWENVFAYDVEQANQFIPKSGFIIRAMFQAMLRLGVKLDFISGLLLKSLELTGTKEFRGVQTRLGEVLAYRELIWSLTEAMVRNPEPWIGGSVQPEPQACDSYRWISTVIYPKIREIIFQDLGSALIYLPSHVKDFAVPELRGYLDKYVRGSGGVAAEERVKTLKMLWDAVGTEFGGRHELYERNYQGNHEQIRVSIFGAGEGRGWNKQLIAFAEQAMSEYDMEGWTLPELQ